MASWSDSVRELIGSGELPAIVLERLAYGNTNWWVLDVADELDDLLPQLRSGSVVSFYLDSRIEELRYFDEGKIRASVVLRDIGEVCLGLRTGFDGRIDMEYISVGELAEFESVLGTDSKVFVGEFPDRSNDNVTSVTTTVPDADGIARSYPH